MDGLKTVIENGFIGILILLSVVAVAIAVERTLVFRAIRITDYTNRMALELTLSNRLHIIATIGSNAPYLGLLGTVMGIMMTFYSLGIEGFMDTGRIMVGLALALKATAAGLIVAMPSIVMYNFLRRRVKVILMQWEIERG